MIHRPWLRLVLLGARWLDRTGLRRIPPIRWLAGGARNLVFRRGDFPNPYVDTAVDGFRLRLPQNLAGGFLRPFEPLTRRFMESSVRVGSTAVDVGANIGVHTLHLARAVGPDGRVHAVEPAEDNLAFLRWNVTANELPNVRIHPFAAGSAERRRTFHLQAKGTLHGFYPRETSTAPTVEVDERPLDQVLTPPVDFIKIDTEGAEVEVLLGMERLVRDSPAVGLLVEWNLAVLHDQDRSLEELPRLLETWGFEVSVIDEEQRRSRRVAEVLESVHSQSFGRLRALNLEARRALGRASAGDRP